MQAFWSRTTSIPGTSTRLQPRSISAVLNNNWRTQRVVRTSICLYTTAAYFDESARHNKQDEQASWSSALALLRERIAEDTAQQAVYTGTPVKDGVRYKDGPMEDEGLDERTRARLERLFPDEVPWPRILEVISTPLAEVPMHNALKDIPQDQEVLRLQSYFPAADALWALLRYDSRLPGAQSLHWEPNTGPALTRHNLPPQSLWSHDHAREKALQRRHTWKKIALQELSIGILVLSLVGFARSQLRPRDFANISSPLEQIALLSKEQLREYRQAMLAQVSRIQKMPVSSPQDDILEAIYASSPFALVKPNYTQDVDGDFVHVTNDMNRSIRRHLRFSDEDWQLKVVALNLANTAHNLLTSSAAPDVQTFNWLISACKRYNLPRMADYAISALEVCKIRPNELSCAIILDHYIRTRRPEHFNKFVAKMRGLGGALMLATPNININEAGEARLVRVKETKVYQKVYPTSLVFDTVMVGVLRWATLDRALQIYFEMKEDGWGLTVPALCQFLLECILQCDWDSGLWIWQEISSIRESVKSSMMVPAYVNMLCLCAVTNNTAAFNHVLREIVTAGQNRQAILKQAMALAERVSKTRQRQDEPVPSPPAWASDNVLIAASASATDTSSEHTSALQIDSVKLDAMDLLRTGIADDEIATAFDSTLNSHEDPDSAAPPSASSHADARPAPAGDPGAAWSAWLELELGSPPMMSDPSDAHDLETKDPRRGAAYRKQIAIKTSHLQRSRQQLDANPKSGSSNG